MKGLTFIAFILVAVAQWYVPASMIWESETALSDGDELLFRTRPVDPSDPFRGKYITLSFEEEDFVTDTVPRYFSGERVFASFTMDSAGFADLVSLHSNDPDESLPWVIEARVAGSYNTDSVQQVQLEFPFNRFYMEESKASDAEKAYWQSVLPTEPERRSYAVVRIKNRRAVLVDVRIGDKSIVEIVNEMNASED